MLQKLLTAIAAAFITIGGCPCFPPPPPPPPPVVVWDIKYSVGMPPTMAGTTGPWTFEFPNSSGSVHYVYRDHPPVASGQTVTMVFEINKSAGAIFEAEDGCWPPQMHLFLQRKGDNLTGKGKYEWYRLWSTFQFARLPDINGEATLSVVLTPNQLTGVFGKHPTQAQMDNTLANLEHAGFTFGGCFWGKGVHMASGAAKFTLKSYEIK